MRILIDLQGSQSESRYRGIGRYSTALAQAIARHRGSHEVILALNGSLPEAVEDIRSDFDGLIKPSDIRLWHCPVPVRDCDPANTRRREAAELLREASIAAMRPDVVLVTSLFEGFGDNAVTSVGLFDTTTPVAAILYDLIPLISPDENVRSNRIYSDSYRRKIESLRRCRALLAISESARQEALTALDWPAEDVTNIFGGCDPRFRPIRMTPAERKALGARLGLRNSFIMYTGGADERKNLDRLIEAFASLPRSLRDSHQLLIVGKMPEASFHALSKTAKRFGLGKNEVIFSGYVSDTELMQLYTASSVFVFPSLHEGFGLPPLEAMACGAPVITSDASSLPEVVGRKDALFDPFSVPTMALKIEQVLSDSAFREDLIRHGAERVRSLGWDDCGRKAVACLERIARPSHVVAGGFNDSVKCQRTDVFGQRSIRILLSKLDHRGDFLLAIPAIRRLRARYPQARFDALIGSWNVDLAKSLEIFEDVHVLDFFAEISLQSPRNPAKLDALARTMPTYDLAVDLRRQADTRFILNAIPALLRVGYATGNAVVDARLDVCLPVAPDQPGILTEANRTPTAIQLLKLLDGIPGNINDYLPAFAPDAVSRSGAMGVAVFPKAGNSIKEWGIDRYVQIVEMLDADQNTPRVGVFLPSENEADLFRGLPATKLQIYCGLDHEALVDSLKTYFVCVANNSYGAHLGSWLGLRVVGIYGGHETADEWGPVFGNSRVLSVPVECSPCHLPALSDCPHGHKCMTEISVERVFREVKAAQAGMDCVSVPELQTELIRNMAPVLAAMPAVETVAFAQSIARSLPQRDRAGLHFDVSGLLVKDAIDSAKAQILVDISELVQKDVGTGIQRVVRNILSEWLKSPPEGYRVEPVYARPNEPYRYARNFTARFTQTQTSGVTDSLIEYAQGDVFLGLDLQPQVVMSHEKTYQHLRMAGVRVVFLVYDLLSIRMPEYFLPGNKEGFESWLNIVAQADGAICISKSVSDDLRLWINDAGQPTYSRPKFSVDWFHLGADLDNHGNQLSENMLDRAILQSFQAVPSFLCVGTLEPRKGIAQALEAFEILWRQGIKANLVLVGKPGWMVDELIKRITGHPELDHRLFWLQGISDNNLEDVYRLCSCLLASSFGEGFGLPLIEAAKKNLPILARNIPVFREVAGDHAAYFKSETPEELAAAIKSWLADHQKNTHPKSSGMNYLTWKESAAMLLKKICQ